MSLSALLRPASIAVVGASKDTTKIGAQILANLIKSDFPGQLYPVNNKETTLIQGLQPFASLTAIPDPVDLAIIVIPAQFVESAVDEAITKKVLSIIIISAGFKEIDSAGAKLEQHIAQKCAKSGITLLGPNCLGLINNLHGATINASFAHHAPQPGNIAFISQSGAFGTAAIDWADNHNLGFSLFVSLGNKAGISENDFLDQRVLSEMHAEGPNFQHASAASDAAVRAAARVNQFGITKPHNQHSKSLMRVENSDSRRANTQVLGLYLEDFKNGQDFIRRAHELTKSIPIIMLKPGKSEQAKTAMQSHTGSLATDDSIISAACEKAGIIRADTSEDLFHYLHAFSRSKPLRGNRIAIITNAGGPGILATDHLKQHGLELAPISAKGQKELSTLLPRAANIHDPVDVLGDAKADRYFHALKVCANEPEVDGIIVILTPQTSTEIEKTAHAITQIQSITDKPIMASFLGGTLVKEGISHLTTNHIASFYYPEQAIKSFGAMYKYSQYQKRNTLAPIPINFSSLTPVARDPQQPLRQLALPEASKVLSQAGIHTAEFQTVRSTTEATQFFTKVGAPVVIKIIAPELLHKTELHAVQTHLQTEAEVLHYFQHMSEVIQKNSIQNASIVMQKQVKGVETFIGMKRDPQFGPVILFGTGGIYTEIFNDIAKGIAPLTRNEAVKMIESTKIGQILAGARGRDKFDTHYIAVILAQLATLCMEDKTIHEIDINPLIITESDDMLSVDAKILV